MCSSSATCVAPVIVVLGSASPAAAVFVFILVFILALINILIDDVLVIVLVVLFLLFLGLIRICVKVVQIRPRALPRLGAHV